MKRAPRCPALRPCRPSYPRALRRVARRAQGEQARASEDRSAAEALYRELLGLPPRERARLVEGDERFASFAVAERLLAASLACRRQHPVEGRELACLALAVAERLDPRRYGSGLVADLEARSWAYLGEAWSESAPAAAREAFDLACSLLRRGSGDPLEEAEILALVAAGSADTVDPASASEGLTDAGRQAEAAIECHRWPAPAIRPAARPRPLGRNCRSSTARRPNRSSSS